MAQYKFVDRNGVESGLLTEGEIQFLYDRGSIHEGTRIFSTDGDRWMSLAQAFPEASWRQGAAPPVVQRPPSPWDAPEAALVESSGSKGRLNWVDYVIAGGIFLLFLIPNLLSSSPQPKPASEAEAMGMECGRFLGLLLPSGLYLLFRKWWTRMVAMLSCGGLLLLLILVAIPFTLGFQKARQRARRADQAEYQRVQAAPWISLELPGQPVEVPVQEQSLMVERQRQQKLLLRDLMIEVATVDMAQGFMVNPPGAVAEQRKRLVSNGVPAIQISEAKPYEAGGGRGLRMDYWTSSGGGRMVFRSVMLAFPKGDESPRMGLLIHVGGKRSETEMDAALSRITDSIRFQLGGEPSQNRMGNISKSK